MINRERSGVNDCNYEIHTILEIHADLTSHAVQARIIITSLEIHASKINKSIQTFMSLCYLNSMHIMQVVQIMNVISRIYFQTNKDSTDYA